MAFKLLFLSRNIFQREDQNILNTTCKKQKKYFGVPSYAERIQICSRMLLDVVECHTMQIPSETEGKNGPFRFEFLSNSVKKC